jgi:hypothetical protein
MSTLLNLGPGKNGTTSMYTLLGNHTDIEACDPKEPQMIGCFRGRWVNKQWIKVKPEYSFDDPVQYYTVWKKENFVYMDATPGMFFRKEQRPTEAQRNNLKFDRYCLLFLIRDHVKYLSSTMWSSDSTEAIDRPEMAMYSTMLNIALRWMNKKDIFVTKLEEAESRQKEIYDWLKIDNVQKFKLKHQNSIMHNNRYGKESVKKYLKYNKLAHQELPRLQGLIDRDKENLEREWNITF